MFSCGCYPNYIDALNIIMDQIYRDERSNALVNVNSPHWGRDSLLSLVQTFARTFHVQTREHQKQGAASI